jgi:hypothetical protein
MTAYGYVGGDPSKVNVSGYTKGDVLAADAAGTLQALPVGPDADVLTADSAAADGVDWQVGSGGGGTPSNTVVAEQAFGQAATAGAVLAYSRGDHTHGTPAAPATPFTTKVTDSGPITTGNISVPNGPGQTQIAPDQVIAASTGDWIGCTINCILNDGGATIIFDAATRVAAADVNYFSSGTGTSLYNGGRGAWYSTQIGTNVFPGISGEVRYQVKVGDISGGNVTVRAYAAGDGGSRTVFANAPFPLRVTLVNYGPGI